MKRFQRKRKENLSKTDSNRPFENLKDLLNQKKLSPSPALPPTVSKSLKTSAQSLPDDDGMQMFRDEMADVVPMHRNMEDCKNGRRKCQSCDNASSAGAERDILARMNRLVESGDGFVVSSTPEYMEGRGYNVSPEITHRLHSGEFAIQSHIDLHGMTASEAWVAFDQFLKQSLSKRIYGVLVVHGRGLSSKAEPVLKAKVCKWLTSGPWRKWIVAFTSARACDGGAGATYILLRRQPATKRFRKKKRRQATGA